MTFEARRRIDCNHICGSVLYFCTFFIRCWAFWALHLSSPNTSLYTDWDFPMKKFTSRQFCLCPASRKPSQHSLQVLAAIQRCRNVTEASLMWQRSGSAVTSSPTWLQFLANATSNRVQSNTTRKLDDISWQIAKNILSANSVATVAIIILLHCEQNCCFASLILSSTAHLYKIKSPLSANIWLSSCTEC